MPFSFYWRGVRLVAVSSFPWSRFAESRQILLVGCLELRGAAGGELLAKAWSSGCWNGMGESIRGGRAHIGRFVHGPHSDHHRKGSVYYTDAFRGYQSLRRYGKHHAVSHAKSLVDRRTKNHINGIEGLWSVAKHIPYNYRGVSKYHFPMYLKEIEYRFNHRQENLFKLFLWCFFGYVSR